MTAGDGIGELDHRIKLKAELAVQFFRFAYQLVMRQQSFCNENFDEGVQDKRIVVIRFLQIGELGDELYFVHTLSTLSFRWRQKKLLIYHIRALGEIFQGLFAFSFHNLSIFLTRLCRNQVVY